MRVVIHIGSHKTGTSWLQHQLRANTDLLRREGIHYPLLADRPNFHQHSSLALDLRSTDQQPALKALAEIRAFTERQRISVLLLSGEEFFFATEEELALLRRELEKRTPCEFRILLYVRNTFDYIRSVMNQHLRFVSYPFTEAVFAAHLSSYQPDIVIRRWESVFGAESVEVCSYDQYRYRLLDHFTEAAALPRLKPSETTIHTRNPSLDFLCATLMNQLLHAEDVSLKIDVYLQLLSRHRATADVLYPAEAAMIESILQQTRIGMSHPKLRSIKTYLAGTRVPHWTQRIAIARLTAALAVIRSALSHE